MTLPLPGPLHSHRGKLVELADLGYTDVWSAESDGADAFTPLALAAAWEPRLRLGTAIVPAFTRSPALMAQSVGSLATAAPGRFAFGIGTSSNVIVEKWNGVPFVEPYKRVRDMVRFLRLALTGEKVTQHYDIVRRHRLQARASCPRRPPRSWWRRSARGCCASPAGRATAPSSTGSSADDVPKVAAIVNAQGDDREIVCRIFVCPSEDTDTVRQAAKFAIAAYLNVPVYAAFHEWLGRGPALRGMWDAWQAGDRKGALASIPDEVVDQLIVHGSPAVCRARIKKYFDLGVTTSSLAIMPLAPIDYWQAVRDLSPTAG